MTSHLLCLTPTEFLKSFEIAIQGGSILSVVVLYWEKFLVNFEVENMMAWHHSGFNVYCREAIWPHNEERLENLARYVIRASLAENHA